MEVELVVQNSAAPFTGIGRYTRELRKHLTPWFSLRIAEQVYPPFDRNLDPLHYFPVGVRDHREGSIVHFTEDLGCSQMFWRPMRPAVATSHDLGFLAWPPEAGMHRALDRLLLRLSYLGLQRMDAVITVSEYSRQTIIRHLQISPERVFTIYSGNDNQFFRPVAGARAKLAKKYGLPDDSNNRYLLYVGAEYPRKNLAAILKVLKQLPQNVKLLKVGSPGGVRFRKSTKKTIAEFGLEDRVLFFDQVPDEDLLLLYNAADLYVCASFLEGFGHPVLEAMACGTPVVCSNASSLPEITGEAAILISPQDVPSFTEAVHQVLYDASLRDYMVSSGFRQAASFPWEKTAKEVTKVYSLVAQSGVC